jgi:hypothetical protein
MDKTHAAKFVACALPFSAIYDDFVASVGKPCAYFLDARLEAAVGGGHAAGADEPDLHGLITCLDTGRHPAKDGD